MLTRLELKSPLVWAMRRTRGTFRGNWDHQASPVSYDMSTSSGICHHNTDYRADTRVTHWENNIETGQPGLLSSLFLSVKLSQLSGQTPGLVIRPDARHTGGHPGHSNVRMMSRMGGRTGQTPDRMSVARLDINPSLPFPRWLIITEWGQPSVKWCHTIVV